MMPQMALVLVDEVHLLNESGRGGALEAGVVCRIKMVGRLREMQQVRSGRRRLCLCIAPGHHHGRRSLPGALWLAHPRASLAALSCCARCRRAAAHRPGALRGRVSDHPQHRGHRRLAGGAAGGAAGVRRGDAAGERARAQQSRGAVQAACVLARQRAGSCWVLPLRSALRVVMT